MSYPFHEIPQKALRLFSGPNARQGYLAAIDQGLISLANFLATIILARNITPTELGVYGVGFTTLRLIRAVQNGLTVTPMSTFGGGMDDEAFRRYVTPNTLIQLILATASALAAALIGHLLTQFGNDTAGPTAFALWSPFIFWQLQEYLRRALYTRGKVLDAVVNTGIANIFRLGSMLWWLSQDRLDGVAGLQSIAIGSLLALLPGVWQTRHFWSRHFDSLKDVWQRNWRFGSFIIGASIANWVCVEAYPIITAGMISFAAAGAYRAVQNLVQPVQLLLRAINTFFTPRAAHKYEEGGIQGIARMLKRAYLATCLPVLGLLTVGVIFSKQILFLLYGETYLEYSNAVILLAVFYALWYLYGPIQNALEAIRHSQPIFIANMTAIVAMFTIGLWFIHTWGVNGTIAGQALNALVVTIVLWISWKKLARGS